MSDKKEREPFFSAQNYKLVKNPLGIDNGITVQVLGICSALAVTAKLEPSIVMSFSVVFVIVFSNIITAALRKTIPPRIRIIVQLTIIAMLVILVDQFLKAFAYDVSKKLSVFVGLIITNCIIMGRLEAFAMGNKVGPSFWDGLGNGIGYAWVLVVVGFFRELFGAGTLTLPAVGELKIIPQVFYDNGYADNGLMILPPMALITVGIIIWIQRTRVRELIDKS
ncbi:MAG: NADH:ubiquinone reductase (Na(+)-transporting) subunit D [Bacteroidetes bacterium]|jgi:Na+-transporting NADH:ubiquinone oxidoreductase subunit D|nr:NADH:ubiquinone reductase (Na(+)-transporting) subunit D [Bacteroidota bacterium]MBT5530764.1 NADH:ubiquinone reductase (Na(+)-transporting) subunit D [Cytophagia bacterium]MBT3421541.1 NADH:ubiquinone reductase (Na(+)-transporting) subunit D [Bacteroidota bacterium]MBT3935002.1 NADH:ubiquinone reductase (Na(+)-transporting) subunit D [Bacteroidota bacterium]MBT4340314.1 NADH:ubiquinone reductase (Na(+)-transporting) subunit D [Bacteroidota bacterium]